ncbi:CLUMA_CG001191, isoform A [Clunio marinus]|uniref:CLUMA_CG001191, isoform A n=1 Tax=Clunio marinus TaxID=568069 RepID=A0A1J1HHA8_9DIPT|nr:CLUMA_CG001191, isoform A [Clunio marinus]
MHKSVRNFDNVCSEKLNAAAIKQNWNTIYDIDDVDEQVNYFNELILELMNFFCPIKICKVNNDCRPDWLSDKLLQLINARNFFYEAARNQKNATEKLFLKQQFIKLRNSVNVMKRNLKRKCLLKRMDVNLPNTILWKNLNTFGVTKSKSTISDSFSSTDFNNYFSSVFTPSDIDSFCDSNEDLSNDVIQELDFENVTNDEVFNALNLIKTKAIGEDGISINPPPIYIGSDIIPYSEDVKSLGLIIDCQLTWQAHITNLCHGINSTLYMLRQTMNITPLNTRKLLVKALIIPRIMYCRCNRKCWAIIEKTFNSCIRYAFDLKKFPRGRTLSLPAKRNCRQLDNSFFCMGVRLWNSLPSDNKIKSFEITSSIFGQAFNAMAVGIRDEE